MSVKSATIALRLLGHVILLRKQHCMHRAASYAYDAVRRSLVQGGHGQSAQHMRE